jgi:hypothetical protein
MSATPGALQLRLLQTVTEVASDKNSTLVMPLPVELLRFFEHTTGTSAGAGDADAVRRAIEAAVEPPAASSSGATNGATHGATHGAEAADPGRLTRGDRADPV